MLRCFPLRWMLKYRYVIWHVTDIRPRMRNMSCTYCILSPTADLFVCFHCLLLSRTVEPFQTPSIKRLYSLWYISYSRLVRLTLGRRCCRRVIHRESKNWTLFHFSITFIDFNNSFTVADRNYPSQTHNWISHFTYSVLLHYLEKCNRMHFFIKTVLLNKSAMHAAISLLVQSRKLWYFLLTFSTLLHDVIMTSYCCQLYAECLVATLCSSRTVHRHTVPRRCNSWTTASKNAKLSCIQPVASKQPRSQFCGWQDLGCHAASCLPQTNP